MEKPESLSLTDVCAEAERLAIDEWEFNDSRLDSWLTPGDAAHRLDVLGQRYYLFLMHLVALSKPRNVLELGTCDGGSAAFMMMALPEDGRLTTVELTKREPSQLAPFLDDPRLRLVTGDDLDLTIYGKQKPNGIDLLFIDTVHEYGHVQAEVDLYLPLMSPGGLLVFDDIQLDEGMMKFWEEMELEKTRVWGMHWSGFGVARAPL